MTLSLSAAAALDLFAAGFEAVATTSRATADAIRALEATVPPYAVELAAAIDPHTQTAHDRLDFLAAHLDHRRAWARHGVPLDVWEPYARWMIEGR